MRTYTWVLFGCAAALWLTVLGAAMSEELHRNIGVIFILAGASAGMTAIALRR